MVDKKLGLIMMVTLGLVACAAPGGGDDGVPSEETEGAEESGGEGTGGGETGAEEAGSEETGGEGETGDEPVDTDGEDPVAACADVPGADAWFPGEVPEIAGASTPERIEAVGAETWALALDLLTLIPSSEESSIANGPASMYIAMGMSYGRFGGECADKIAARMSFPELDTAIHETLGASIAELGSRQIEESDSADPVVLSLRQSTWEFGSGTEPLPPSGLNAAYGAQPNLFTAAPPEARDLINCVIEEQSQGLIVDFLPEGDPKGDTTSYDVNVSYLQAPWNTGMSSRNLDFNLADGSVENVEGFGAYAASVAHYADDNLVAVDIPLRGGELSVLAVMPTSGDIDDFTAGLDGATLEAVRNDLVYTYVDLTLPKVDIAAQTFDYNTMERLNIGCPPFTLRSTFHAGAVQMDEKGIKAAAATANEGWEDGGGEPEPELTVTFDHPFLFFVRDRETDFVLFSGRYSPEAS